MTLSHGIWHADYKAVIRILCARKWIIWHPYAIGIWNLTRISRQFPDFISIQNQKSPRAKLL